MPTTEHLDGPKAVSGETGEENITLHPSETRPTDLRETWSQAGFGRRLQLAFSFLTMLTFLLVTLQFVMTRGSIADPDIWWHLRNAEYLFQNHQLPRQDLYSFTVSGAPWINHEWLAEVPYYLAWRAWGLAGINAVTLLVIELIFLGLLYLCYQESGHFKASIAACCFCTFLAKVSYGPRTILFGYLYLVILLIILQRFRRKGHAPLWLIPPLFCLWINTHGSWSLGLILFSIIAAAGLVKKGCGMVDAEPWSPSQIRKLVVTGVASVAALFVNPFGARLVFYPFDLAFRQKLNISHVAEWVSVDFHDLRGKLVLVLLVALFLAALLRRRRWTVGRSGPAAVCPVQRPHLHPLSVPDRHRGGASAGQTSGLCAALSCRDGYARDQWRGHLPDDWQHVVFLALHHSVAEYRCRAISQPRSSPS